MAILQFQGEYRWLSNFWHCPAGIMLGNLRFENVECAYQAAKCADVNDPKRFRNILPGAAKRLGRQVSIREDWERVKLSVMGDLLRQKFLDPVLRAKLLATGYEELIEGNSWGDRFWGVTQNGKGSGKNHLGNLIMRIRDELRMQEHHN